MVTLLLTPFLNTVTTEEIKTRKWLLLYDEERKAGYSTLRGICPRLAAF